MTLKGKLKLFLRKCLSFDQILSLLQIHLRENILKAEKMLHFEDAHNIIIYKRKIRLKITQMLDNMEIVK